MTVTPMKQHCAAYEEAYRKLETPVGHVRSQALVLELVSEECLNAGLGPWERKITEQIPALAGYRIIILTHAQAAALDYVIYHMGEVADGLHDAYNSAFKTCAGRAER